MIKKITKEYEKDGVAYQEITLSLLGLLLYRRVNTTTNATVVQGLKSNFIKMPKVKGFKYETKNKSKKTV